MRCKKICIAVIVIVMMLASCIYANIMLKSDDENLKMELYKDEWALYNYGQSINGVIGVNGVDINIIKAWQLTKGSSDVIVGVVDTGIDTSLNIFSNALWYNDKEVLQNGIDDDSNGYIDDYYGWDFYSNDDSIYDDYLYDYHGTYLAGIIHKITPEVKILSSKFLRGTEGDVVDSVSAIQYAIDNGAVIVNCSWCFESEQIELYELMKENQDILFVCAAGNSRLNLDENAVYPACYELDNVITVMAIDNTGNMYDISGYGMNVDVAAPGKDIYVCLPENENTFVSGTSASTAFAV